MTARAPQTSATPPIQWRMTSPRWQSSQTRASMVSSFRVREMWVTTRRRSRSGGTGEGLPGFRLGIALARRRLRHLGRSAGQVRRVSLEEAEDGIVADVDAALLAGDLVAVDDADQHGGV